MSTTNQTKEFTLGTKALIVLGVLLILAAIIMVVQVRGGTTLNLSLTTNPDLERGLVGHWTFDGNENPENVLFDRSGNGNHGMFVGGMSTTTSVLGKIGQALTFNGGNDGVQTGVSISDMGGEKGTFSAWVKRNGSANGDIIMDDSSGDTHELSSNNDNSFQFRIYDGASKVSTSEIHNEDKWYHVVGTWKNDEFIRIYVDSILEDEKSLGEAFVGSANLYIGFGGDQRYGAFNGVIDDARVYDRVLSDEEIRRLYELGATTRINQSINTNPDLERGLISHWTFDSSVNPQNVLYDRSGNGVHGTFNANLSTSTAVATGVIGQALEFNAGEITANYGSTIDTNNGVAIALWILPISTGTTQRYILSNSPDAGILSQIRDFNQQIDYRVGGAQQFYNAFLNFGEWNHIVLSYDGATAKVFLDGVFEDSQSIGDGVSFSQLTFGSDSFKFKGFMDDIRVYDRVISDEEIRRLYDLGATTRINQSINTNPDLERGLIGHWTFDSAVNPQNVAYDRSGNGNHGTLTNMSTSTAVSTGIIGQALEFDGSDDVVEVEGGDGSEFDMGGSNLTLASWIKTTTDGVVMQKCQGTCGDMWVLRVDGNGKANVEFEAGAGTNPNAISSISVDDGEWHHIAGVRDGLRSLKVYVDGTQDGSDSQESGNTGIDTNTNVEIGSTIFSGYTDFDGMLDDVRVYNRALSADEVKRLYNLGR